VLHDFAVESSICYIQARQLIEGDSSVHGSAFRQETPYRPLLLEKLISHIAALFAMPPKIKMKEITSQLVEWGDQEVSQSLAGRMEGITNSPDKD
jgi:hypothetical protein